MSFRGELKDSVPPHNFEAEEAVLGSILLDSRAFDKAVAHIRPQDFYRQANQKIFSVIEDLIAKSKACDLVTLSDELRSRKELDVVGGAVYLAQLGQSVPSSANIEYYAEIVKECSVRRQIMHAASDMIAQSFDESLDSRQVLDLAEKAIFSLALNKKETGYRPITQILPDAIKRIEDAIKAKNAYTGVPSGFSKLDALTSGFQESDYVIIGARPSMGKTALALSMAAHIAFDESIPTGFFSLEMPDVLIIQRLIAMRSRINSQAMRTGMLRSADIAAIVDAAGAINEAPLYIADSPNMSILDLKSQARSMVKDCGVKVIFIDYMGLIGAERPDLPRWEQVAEISRSLKALARELKVPIIALSQVSRDTEGKEPSLSNLRESGAIEQDADMVLFIHRDRNTDSEPEDIPPIQETKLILAKQRNGPIGTVKIGYRNQFTLFEDLS